MGPTSLSEIKPMQYFDSEIIGKNKKNNKGNTNENLKQNNMNKVVKNEGDTELK